MISKFAVEMMSPALPVGSSVAAMSGIIRTIEHAFEPIREVLRPILSNPTVFAVWVGIVAISLGVL